MLLKFLNLVVHRLDFFCIFVFIISLDNAVCGYGGQWRTIKGRIWQLDFSRFSVRLEMLLSTP